MRNHGSLIKGGKVSKLEIYLGYFLGPFAVMLMNSILNNYLNVYYTDVLQLSSLWDGAFLTTFPLVVKLIDAFTFVIMGIVIEKVHFKDGKARPWILISAPLMVVSMISLFAIPKVSDAFTIVWVFVSYNLFYSIAYTIYNTAHVLMIPLSTKDKEDRKRLSVVANCQGMLSGGLVSVLFPTFIVPWMGTSEGLWVLIMTIVAIGALPFVMMEFFFTRERISEENEIQRRPDEKKENIPLTKQLRDCFRSRQWVLFMIFVMFSSIVNNTANHAVFYYCNWVLGTYNDGKTQMYYYVIGNMPLGLGLFLARPIAKKFGMIRSIIVGYLVATVGILICVINPYNLWMVLIGQFVKSVGLIPLTFLQSSLLADSLDNVKTISGHRADGVSSASYNVINTITVGLSLFILNIGLTIFGYVAPADNPSMSQNQAMQSYFIVLAMGLQLILFPLMAVLFYFYGKKDKNEHQRQQEISKQ